MKVHDRLLRMMPLRLKAVAKAAVEPVDRVRMRFWRRRNPVHASVPGLRLRSRVGSGFRPAEFIEGGLRIASEVEPFMADLAPGSRVLDFGCGSGRVIVPLANDHPTLALHGCDVDSEAIEWASREISGAQFFVNESSPPLPVDDGSFDFVYSISILTHLPEAAQLEWIAELRRITSTSGRVLVTTCGQRMFDEVRAENIASNSRDFTRRLREFAEAGDMGEFRFLPYVRSRANDRDLSGVQDEYGLTFQTPDYSESAWSQWFALESVALAGINGMQDALVLRPA